MDPSYACVCHLLPALGLQANLTAGAALRRDTKEVLTHFEDIATLESGIDPKVEARLVRKLE